MIPRPSLSTLARVRDQTTWVTSSQSQADAAKPRPQPPELAVGNCKYWRQCKSVTAPRWSTQRHVITTFVTPALDRPLRLSKDTTFLVTSRQMQTPRHRYRFATSWWRLKRGSQRRWIDKMKCVWFHSFKESFVSGIPPIYGVLEALKTTKLTLPYWVIHPDRSWSVRWPCHVSVVKPVDWIVVRSM